MPKLPRKAAIILAYTKLLFRPGWLMPKPVYTACGLLLIAGLLMLSVVNSLKDAATVPQNNYSAVDQSQQEQLKEPVVIIQSEAETKPETSPTVVSAVKSVGRAQHDYENEKPRWPVRGQVIYGFGWQQHPIFNDWRYHNGIDISTPGSQTVQAVIGGVVEEIYNDKNYGQTVIVKSGRYTIIYGSLGSVAVSTKEAVVNGAKIGTTGSYTAEPQIHLHLAIKDGEKFIEPGNFIK